MSEVQDKIFDIIAKEATIDRAKINPGSTLKDLQIPSLNMATDMLLVRVAAEVRNFDPLKHFDEKRLALLDRVTQFALVAARQAVAQSGLEFRKSGLGERTAVILGSGVGGQNTLDDSYKRLYLERNTRCHPLTIPRL